jgi:hypothetical protein
MITVVDTNIFLDVLPPNEGFYDAPSKPWRTPPTQVPWWSATLRTLSSVYTLVRNVNATPF